MAKSYSCNRCPYTTGDKKKIREHVRKVHGVKGGAGHSSHSRTSDITSSYTAKEV